jgi:hypothetical protein
MKKAANKGKKYYAIIDKKGRLFQIHGEIFNIYIPAIFTKKKEANELYKKEYGEQVVKVIVNIIK